MILKVVSLKKYFGNKKNIVKAVDDVSFHINDGEFISIIGDSGSGKTTLLNLLGGLTKPTEGKIIINDINISELKEDELTKFRREQIGIIFQDYNLVHFLTSYENIVLPISLSGKKLDEQLLDYIIKKLDINDKLNSYPEELSGGQKQRIAIARALLMKPNIILADEPTGSLDSRNSKEVFSLLRNMSKDLSQTVVFVTHNIILAKQCDHMIHLKDGRIASY